MGKSKINNVPVILESQLQDYINEGMKSELEITRNRIKLLKQILISRIKEIRLFAHQLFNRMDDWIIYGLKSENDLIYDGIQHIKQSIQSGQLAAIQNFDYHKISTYYKPLVYLDDLPYLLPSFENQTQKNAFTITNLKLLIEDFKTLTAYDNIFIQREQLGNYFVRRLANPEIQWIFSTILEANDPLAFDRMLSLLESKYNESIPLAKLSTYFILLNVQLPTKEQLNDYEELLQELYEKMVIEQKQKEIPLLSFIEIPCWFDSMGGEIIEIDNISFNRIKFQKKLLFEINRDDLDLFNYKTLLENLIPIEQDDFRAPKTYHEILFNDISF